MYAYSKKENLAFDKNWLRRIYGPEETVKHMTAGRELKHVYIGSV